LSWFSRSRSYQKKAGGKEWTKNAIIIQIAKELGALLPSQKGNNLIFKEDNTIKLEFIADNFADKNRVELNATIFFSYAEQDLMWFDIFHLAKVYYGDNYRALSIMRDEEWDGSNIQKECQEFLLPLMQILLKKGTAFELLEKGRVESSGFMFAVANDPDHKMILDNGKAIVKVIR
jgi:hypothetical protein